MASVKQLISTIVPLVLLQSASGVYGAYEGFWTSNFNETITICPLDVERDLYLLRTHWPNTPFNEDSAAMSAVEVTMNSTMGTLYHYLHGVGSSSNGKYEFEFELEEGSMNATGSFDWIAKNEKPSSGEARRYLRRQLHGDDGEKDSRDEGGEEARADEDGDDYDDMDDYDDDEEEGAWLIYYQREATDEECALVRTAAGYWVEGLPCVDGDLTAEEKALP